MDIREHKSKFQLERMILFSDAVFAIAITLLVIELKIPEMDSISNTSLAHALLQTIPHFISFFISFMIIGIYWIAHHRMFYYVINYDNKLLWLNLLLLFFIVLMPFSSNIYSIYNSLNAAFILYVFNISMLSFFIFRMYDHISTKRTLSHGLENTRLVNYYKTRSWVVPLCFGIGVFIALVFPRSAWSIALSRMSPILIFPALSIIKRKYKDVIT